LSVTRSIFKNYVSNIRRPTLCIYLEDITIHSPTIEKHREDIKEVLQTLKNVSSKINLSRCKWFKTSIQILGHIMNGDTI
jgi:hypothetical protein